MKMNMLRCYDCFFHILDADAARSHWHSTGHEQWVAVVHDTAPQEDRDE